MELTTLGIAAGAWLWEQYGTKVVAKSADAAKGKWDKVKWTEAAERYRAKVKKLYGTMQIFGMTEPVPLDGIFTDAYMLDKPTALRRFDIERLKQLSTEPDGQRAAERINGLRLVVEKDNLFILGKPGAGKTTFLKYIALKAAEQTIDKVPIFISLKHWGDSGIDLISFIVERFDVCNFPLAQPFVEELLKSGNAIALFDGLDEVNHERGQRDKQTRAMNNFIEKYDRTQCLITCRIAASDYSFKPFTYVEIADFTEKQINQFVGNWFHKDQETRDRFLSEFGKEDNKGLRELARAPLLLTLLCLAFNETLTFPQRRVEIYEEAVDALLKKWDSSRRIKRDEVYRKLSLGHKENMLALIAAETFEKNKYFIAQGELENLITNYARNVPPHDTKEATDGGVILKAIEAQHGIFVERAREVYSFSHLTFQEYFTAKYIVSNSGQATLTNLVAHSEDKRWREVFLLTTSLLPDASEFVSVFRAHLDELLGKSPQLSKLLKWAEKKAESSGADSWVARPYYLFVDLYDRGMISALENVVFQEANTPSGTPSIDLDDILAIMLDAALGLDDEEFADTRATAVESAQEFGLKELAAQLSALTISPEADHQFVDKLRSLLIQHRDIGHQWRLTEGEQEQLAAYLSAAGLLKSCLDLATMSVDAKKTMLNDLYLAPSEYPL